MQRFYVRCMYFVLYFSYRVEFFVAEANYNGVAIAATPREKKSECYSRVWSPVVT